MDIAVDLPYGRVAHRFFKVPEFLAQDFVDQGETADCDWMIMTDDDAYVMFHPRADFGIATYALVNRAVIGAFSSIFITVPLFASVGM